MIPIFETVPPEFDCARCVPGDCGTDLLRRFDALRPLQAFVLAATEDPAPLLARLQAERPGLFEWSPLQEGPPAWRIEIARRESRPGEARAITEALEWDHDRLDRLERMAFDAWAAGDLCEAETAFGLFAHGLRRHIGFEEALIFPEFERRTGVAPGSGPTMTMRTEHRQILSLLAALELAIESDAASVGLLRQHLQDLLRSHNRKEEEVLYPVTDSVLTRGQRDDLMRRVQLFHSEMMPRARRSLTATACHVFATILFVSALLPMASNVTAQQTAEAIASGTSGDALFKTYCGSCHGKSAKGDGPLADALRFRPADLTLIAKRNGGKFDADKVYRIIDGRDGVKGHGGTDMPVWGDAFKRSVEGYSEKAVKARIRAIVEYLKSVQVK